MTTAPTSVMAYHELIRSGGLTAKCKELVACYYRNGVLADYEVAGILRWDKSEVSARRNDLMEKDEEGRCTGIGKVIEYGMKVNPHTRKTVVIYKLNIGEQPTLI